MSKLACRCGVALLLAGGICGAAEPHLLSSTLAGSGTLLLSGTDWRVAESEPGSGTTNQAFDEGFPLTESFPATVPGDVHWDLERARRVPPIFYGTNSQALGWVAGKEWWYRKTFTVPAEWQDKQVRLRFEGVDYEAEVWLNRIRLGGHEGQFTPFEFEVSRALRFRATNVLAVLIHPAPAQVREAIAAGKGEWPVMQAMRRVYPRWKSPTNAGWDWGAKIITMGIWQDVRLIAADGPYISQLTVLPELAPPYDQAKLNLQARVEAPAPVPVEFCGEIECLTAGRHPLRFLHHLELRAGSQEVAFTVSVPQPLLWWPNGYGAQHLYRLTLAAKDRARQSESNPLAATFGIRDLQMLPNPQSPDNVEYIDYTTDQAMTHKLPQPPPERKYLIQINGRRIFARGGNWIPCDLLYGRPRQPFYEHRLRAAALAHFNLFRIWGGGLIEKPIFYDLCDRYGIMLFQEFPNAGARWAEDEAALAISARETRQVLPGLMNHPCIVRYGGGNEWYRNATNSPQMAQLRRLCAELDPTRPFHDPDPECIAQRHGPYAYDYAHHYETYNSGRPLTAGPDDPLEWTEYGASGAASVATLRAIMPEADRWPVRPNDPFWIWHKAFEAFGSDNWMGSAQYRYLFGDLPDLATTVRCSQFVQAEGLRYANQAMRRHAWHRSACAFWTYDEPWPNAAHGCVLEYSGRPKMAYYYVKQSYAPVDISAVYPSLIHETGKPLAVEIWATNDQAQPRRAGRSRYQLLDLQGRVLAQGDCAVSLAAESSQKLCRVDWVPPASLAGSVALLDLELLDRAGDPTARNLYTFAFREPETNGAPRQTAPGAQPPLRALLQAPQTALKICGIRMRKTSQSAVQSGLVEVLNTGAAPALFAKLDTQMPSGTDIYWEDNYLFLRPGERRKVKFTLVNNEASAHSNRSLTFQVQAWNTPSASFLAR